jgi:hypothetical protein
MNVRLSNVFVRAGLKPAPTHVTFLCSFFRVYNEDKALTAKS